MTTLTEGLIFSIMVLGVFISYKILDFPDLTVDGSFVLGGAILSRSLSLGLSPLAGMLLSMIAGSIAGLITGIIHTKFKVTNLLSGILVMIGLYSINLRIIGSSNIALFNKRLFLSGDYLLLKVIIVSVLAKLILDLFFMSKLGYMIKLVGVNPLLIENLGLNPMGYKILGLCISNGLVALAGSLMSQYQGYVDINMGTGILVMGLASIILGEALMKYTPMKYLTTAAILGSLAYRLALITTLNLGFNPSDLKLITSVILLAILIANNSGGLISSNRRSNHARI